jgi:hypothetical protein
MNYKSRLLYLSLSNRVNFFNEALTALQLHKTALRRLKNGSYRSLRDKFRIILMCDFAYLC